MPDWVWWMIGIALAGFVTTIQAKSEVVGKLVTNILRKRLGKMGGRTLEKALFIRPTVGFLLGVVHDDKDGIEQIIKLFHKRAKELAAATEASLDAAADEGPLTGFEASERKREKLGLPRRKKQNGA